MNSQSVTATVKDTELIDKRRKQIIRAAIHLFKEKGFHRTTTREIAHEAGFSIGTLYEYVRSKDDVLFLVYESIHDKVYRHLEAVGKKLSGSSEETYAFIRAYFYLMDQMQEEVLILYQEIKSLQTGRREQVLQTERNMVGLMKQAIMHMKEWEVDKKKAEIIANNLFVQGHMWCFRRWTLHKQFTIEEYVDLQLQLFAGSIQSLKEG